MLAGITAFSPAAISIRSPEASNTVPGAAAWQARAGVAVQLPRQQCAFNHRCRAENQPDRRAVRRDARTCRSSATAPWRGFGS